MSLTCPRCPKVCNFPSELRRHLLSHLKTEKKAYAGSHFACSEKECGKIYACKNDLKKHYRIHTDKALVCTVDAMKFATKQALLRHMIVHSGEKPFKCAVCGNKFGQPANLRTHVKTVHNYSVGMNRANKCEYCGQAQSSIVSLHHHLLEKHTHQVQKAMETELHTINYRKEQLMKRKDKTPVEHNKAEIDIIINKLKGQEESLQLEFIEEVLIVPNQPEIMDDHQTENMESKFDKTIISEIVVTKQPNIKDDEPAEEVSEVVPEWEMDHDIQLGGDLVRGVDWEMAPSSGRFYTCEQCRKTFGWRFEILFHGLCHLTDDQGQAMNRTCPECEITFKAAGGLKDHLIRHTREMPFLCLHCGKSLASQIDLKVHIESEHLVTPGQNLVVEEVKMRVKEVKMGEVEMRWEEVEETRNQVVFV